MDLYISRLNKPILLQPELRKNANHLYFALERKISYNDLRKRSKTHFVERHMFKSNTEAYQFQYKLCHHFGDCMATMNNDIAYVVKFDEEEFNQHYSPHLENAAKTRINQLFESNFFLNHYGGKCE